MDNVAPALEGCPRQVIHNAANDYNVLRIEAYAVCAFLDFCGLLDFGGMAESWRIV